MIVTNWPLEFTGTIKRMKPETAKKLFNFDLPDDAKGVTFVRRGKETIIKAYYPEYYKSKSKSSEETNKYMKIINKIGHTHLEDIIRPIWNEPARKKKFYCGFNYFASRNLKRIRKGVDKMLISTGELMPPEIKEIKRDKEAVRIKINNPRGFVRDTLAKARIRWSTCSQTHKLHLSDLSTRGGQAIASLRSLLQDTPPLAGQRPVIVPISGTQQSAARDNNQTNSNNQIFPPLAGQRPVIVPISGTQQSAARDKIQTMTNKQTGDGTSPLQKDAIKMEVGIFVVNPRIFWFKHIKPKVYEGEIYLRVKSEEAVLFLYHKSGDRYSDSVAVRITRGAQTQIPKSQFQTKSKVQSPKKLKPQM